MALMRHAPNGRPELLARRAAGVSPPPGRWRPRRPRAASVPMSSVTAMRPTASRSHHNSSNSKPSMICAASSDVPTGTRRVDRQGRNARPRGTTLTARPTISGHAPRASAASPDAFLKEEPVLTLEAGGCGARHPTIGDVEWHDSRTTLMSGAAASAIARCPCEPEVPQPNRAPRYRRRAAQGFGLCEA